MAKVRQPSIDLLDDPKFNQFIKAFTQLSKSSQSVSLNEARKLSTQFFLPPDTVYEPVKHIENIEITGNSHHKIPLRIFIPTSTKPTLPILIYLHRGGWVFGSIEGSDPICRKLANHLECIVIAVEYRLAPENPFPKPLEDCYEATQWISKNARRFNGEPQNLIVCGESAGGNLAAAVAIMARDQNGPSISTQLLICPAIRANMPDAAYDQSIDRYFLTKEAMKFFWNAYLQSPGDSENIYASVDRSKDFSKLPPALIITAEYDPLHFEANEYAQKLKKAGVEVVSKCFPGVIHGFIDLPIYEEKQKIFWINEIGILLKNLNTSNYGYFRK